MVVLGKWIGGILQTQAGVIKMLYLTISNMFVTSDVFHPLTIGWKPALELTNVPKKAGRQGYDNIQ
jgi:hypothetical protein